MGRIARPWAATLSRKTTRYDIPEDTKSETARENASTPAKKEKHSRSADLISNGLPFLLGTLTNS